MKCLRCGAELKDSTVFCAECSRVAAVPLKTSPYLTKKIVLPTRKPSQSIKKSEVKKARKHRPWGWVLCSLLLFLLCGALLLQAAYSTLQNRQAQQELDRLQSVEDECVRLTDKLRQTEDTVSSLEEELSKLGSSAYLELREDLNQVQSEKSALSEELTQARSRVEALEAQIEELREKTEFFDTHIVFMQEDGSNRFHSYDCEKFTRNGYWAYNKQQAVTMGYHPCPLCQ